MPSNGPTHYARKRSNTASPLTVGLRREFWDPSYQGAGADASARKEWLTRLRRVELELGRSGATPIRPRARGELPVDIWERVLNEFRDHPRVLFICACVCRTWYSHASRSLPRIDDAWELAGRADVMRVARVFGWEYPSVRMQRKWRAVVVRGGHTTRSLAHLKTFAAALAKQLCRIDELEIRSGDWRPGSADAPTFARFSACIALSRLTLRGITFPSTTLVAKLICALPNLARLSIVDVKTIEKRRGHDLCLPHGRPLRLRWLLLDSTGVDDVVEFLADADIMCRVTQATLVIRAAKLGMLTDPETSGYPAFLRGATSLETLTVELRDSDNHNLGLMNALSLATNHTLKEVHFVLYQNVDSMLLFRNYNTSLLSGLTPGHLCRIGIKFVVEDKPGQLSSAAHSGVPNPQLRLMRDLANDLDFSALDHLLSSPRFASRWLAVVISLDASWRVRDSYAVWKRHVERQFAKTRRTHLVFVWVET
ncbi:uncharacterized protein B0H18DRAFT_1030417 [Fomitopsis serialis]|uniref:uncharacterized protein n=1 Tax=Fomitopsis serialis TaxID=139415 RepID=UPI0020087CA2|nr:uncharacterized protein B0H18DRAFT_1030417 [Neoantrodia serialis]KAH9918685.1 hypothetical protein B0H18DRAFT_1030417 [Neoantrodia serialis]